MIKNEYNLIKNGLLENSLPVREKICQIQAQSIAGKNIENIDCSILFSLIICTFAAVLRSFQNP